MSDITDPTCPASAGEAAQEQAAPAAELSTPGASLENFSVAEPENALPRATLETLPETIAAACGRAGWTSLMPVQSLALPYLLEGRDIMVQSRTGSGKTGCYLLPLVPRLDPELHAAQALILVPTRELAVQVEHEARTLFEGTGIRPVAVYGGVGYKKQMDALRDGAQLVVGTPGRVLDHLLRRTLSLDDLDALVFDEADRMLSIGFYPDMKEVQRYLPRRRIHTSMFSATYPPHVLKLAGEFLTEPSMLSLSQKEVHVAEVQHLFCQSRPMDKDRVLVRLLESRSNPEGELELPESDLREALALVDTEAVYAGRDGMRLERQGMGLTLDGIAKGHIVDAMSAVLLRAGCENHLINAGGDILARGHKAPGVFWRVAVEDPEKRGHYPQVLELYNQAIATSGGYEMHYDAEGRHHHLLDPSTGRSPVLGSMSVLAATCMQADALATGLSVLPAGEALTLADSLSGCACGLLRRDGRLQVSRRWPAEA